jgi:uncharacterized membrane protein YhaH (DUF805 family)
VIGMAGEPSLRRGAGVDFSAFYFSPRGRISRRDSWLRWGVPALAIGIICEFVDSQLGLHLQLGHRSRGIVFTAMQVLVFWPATAVQIKRLHDTNKSGWWVAALMLFNLASFGLPGAASEGRLSLRMWVSFCVGIAFFYFVGFKPGDTRSNRFGPDPIYKKANETGVAR